MLIFFAKFSHTAFNEGGGIKNKQNFARPDLDSNASQALNKFEDRLEGY